MASVVLLLLCVVHGTAGLLCYQCETAGKEGSCISDYQQFLDVSKQFVNRSTSSVTVEDGGQADDFIPHYKDCTTFINRTMCIIESVKGGISGEYMSFIRDCSDGYTFNFDLPVLQNLSPSNYTTCGYDPRGFQVCVTLCNQTDFCNGPKYVEAASANSMHLPVTMSFCLTMLLFNIFVGF